MKNTAYRQQMDQMHVPKARSDETLRRMLEENQRLRRSEARGKAPLLRRIPLYAAAAAACLLLVFFGVRQFRPTAYPAVRMADLNGIHETFPQSDTLSFREAFGPDADRLFSGWTIDHDSARRLSVEDPDRYQAQMTLRANGSELQAVVSDTEPQLLTHLKSVSRPSDDQIYFARDDDTHTLYAVFESFSLYVTLSSDSMQQAAFEAAVRSIKK